MKNQINMSQYQAYGLNVTFRELQASDVPFLIPLMDQLGYPISLEVMIENVQHYLVLPNQKAWVAEKSAHVVGCVAVAITKSFHTQGSFLRVITMVIDQNHRRMGLGKHLLGIVEQFAKDHGCTHIELTSGVHRAKLGSHDFYLQLGYSELNDTKKYFVKQLLQSKIEFPII
jgi:GNAT superfamily N-acetyltransferase